MTVAVLLVTLIAGCGDRNARQEFDRQIEICSAGERNGVLSAAADACGAALAIAKARNYPSDEIVGLTLRLGRIERQRGRFDEAEALVRASLTPDNRAGDSVDVATRIVELALILAGQGRWEEGAVLLEEAEPTVQALAGSERLAAANAFRGYAARFRKSGDSTLASRFDAVASELGEP